MSDEQVPNRTVTQRGFTGYDDLTDTNGARVRVQDSSAAWVGTPEGGEDGPFVWIFIEGGQVKGNSGSAHLNPASARRVRDALDAFLTEVGEN